MLTQEEYMDAQALRHQGWTLAEIADELGYHPATISARLRNGGPPARRAVAASQRAIDERSTARIAELIIPPSNCCPPACSTSSPPKASPAPTPRWCERCAACAIRAFARAAEVSVPVGRAPSEESQFDWSNCSDRAHPDRNA